MNSFACTCGDPRAPGIVHRLNAPCYHEGKNTLRTDLEATLLAVLDVIKVADHHGQVSYVIDRIIQHFEAALPDAIRNDVTRQMRAFYVVMHALEKECLRTQETRAQVETKLNDALALLESNRETIKTLRRVLEDECINRRSLAGELAQTIKQLNATVSAAQHLRDLTAGRAEAEARKGNHLLGSICAAAVSSWNASQRLPTGKPCAYHESELMNCPTMLAHDKSDPGFLTCKVCARSVMIT